jgi:hypothetical protein
MGWTDWETSHSVVSVRTYSLLFGRNFGGSCSGSNDKPRGRYALHLYERNSVKQTFTDLLNTITQCAHNYDGGVNILFKRTEHTKHGLIHKYDDDEYELISCY